MSETKDMQPLMARPLVGLVMLLLSAGVIAQPSAGARENSSLDGLQQVKIKGLDVAYARPGATLAGYTKVLIDPIEVSFHKDWKARAPGTGRSLSTDELQRIRSNVAKLVYDTFVRELGKGGYAVVTAPGPDVLGVTAQIINLYINAPDVATAGRTRVYTLSAGQMTLAATLTDSETGEVIARVGDRYTARNVGRLTLSSSTTNAAEAQNAASRWAGILVSELDKAKAIGKP